MGIGSLKRIAALCTLATTAVLAGGAVSVPAQLSVPSTTVTVPAPTVTVPSTTVRVPSTTTTVTTPPVEVRTPKPVVKSPGVTAPAPRAPAPAAVSKPVQKVTQTISPTADAAGGTAKRTLDTASKVGGTSGGSSSGGGTLDVGAVTGGLTQTATGAVGGRDGGIVSSPTGQGAGTGLVRGPGGMTFLAGPGGGGGTGAGPSALFGVGPGGGSASTGGRSLAAMLAGASTKELRAVLEQLEGCLPALSAVDRRVISLRAGLAGSPLTRAQVGRRLGLSPSAVRSSERRALNRLQYAAATTGCAAAVVGPFDPAGVGNLAPQLVLAGAVPVHTNVASGELTQGRGIAGRSASPLFGLGGGDGGGPAWAIVLFTVLLSVSVAALTREVRQSV